MATVLIQKRDRQKRISYIIYYKDPFTGQRKYYKTFQRQRDAQQAANDLRYLLDSGKKPDQQKGRISLLSFADVAEQLKSQWIRRLAIGELRMKTVEVYRINLETVSKVFGDKLLCEITVDAVEKYRSSVATDFSNVYANKQLAVVKKVFRLGVELRALTENLIEGISFLSEKENERNRFLLPHQLEKLIDAARQTKAKHYLPALIYLGAEHGASKQEALSLKWSDIDFDFGDVGSINFFRTKNGRERTEFLMPRTKDELLAWRENQQLLRVKKNIGIESLDFVFSHLDGAPINCFNRAWWAACRSAGIADFHFHDLRHTFCSNLILSGAGIKDVKEMIGHGDISMTDRYSHLTCMHKFFRQQQLAEYYSKG